MSRTSWGSGRRFSAGLSLKDMRNLVFVTGSVEHSHEPVEKKQELGLSLNSSMCKLARVLLMFLFISSKLKLAHGWFAWAEWWPVLCRYDKLTAGQTLNAWGLGMAMAQDLDFAVSPWDSFPFKGQFGKCIECAVSGFWSCRIENRCANLEGNWQTFKKMFQSSSFVFLFSMGLLCGIALIGQKILREADSSLRILY